MKASTNDPVKLREKARQLIEQAEKLERETFEKAGKVTMKYYHSGFSDFDLEKFRKEIMGAIS